MRKTLNLLMILLCVIFPQINYAAIVGANGEPREQVVSIFRKMGFPTTQNPTLESLNAYGQKHLLRPSKSERLSPEAIAFYNELLTDKNDADKTLLLNLFEQIGDIEAIYPSAQPVNYILIMGSTVGSMRARLMFLAQLFEEGKIQVDPTVPIVFLTGDRELFKSETPDVLLDPASFPVNPDWKAPTKLPTNEMQLGEFIWEQLKLPDSLRVHTPIFVKSPKRADEKRAQTDDTVIAWLDGYHVEPGHCLIISENPFVYYQELVTRVVFRRVKPEAQGFTFEAVGPSNREATQEIDVNLGVLLDNLARTLYLQVQLKELNNAKVVEK